MKHTVSILWKSGRITRHRTTGLTVRHVGENVTGLESDYLMPRIVHIDVTEIAMIVRGRLR